MRVVIATVLLLTLIVQYRIWVGEDSLAGVWRLEQQVAAQRAENGGLAERNERLAAEARGRVKDKP